MLKRSKTKSLYDRAIEKKNEKIEKEKLYKDLNLDKDKNTIVFDKEKLRKMEQSARTLYNRNCLDDIYNEIQTL